MQLWGGIVINGNGITNNCTDAQRTSQRLPRRVGRPTVVLRRQRQRRTAPVVLRYVVVKHTGFEVAPGDELNGVTFNAVGSGTTVENVEVYSAYDDGVEFFGGAVNVTNLSRCTCATTRSTSPTATVGTINNALVIHSPTDGNRCIEGDNVASTRLAGGASQTPLRSRADDQPHDVHPVELRRRHARRLGRPDHSLRRAHDPLRQHHRRRPRDGQARRCAVERVLRARPRPQHPTRRTLRLPATRTLNRTVIVVPGGLRLGRRGQSGRTATPVCSGSCNGAGTAATYTFNTNNVVITDPANANVRVLQPNTFFSFDSDASATTVTVVDAARLTSSSVLTVTDGYIGAVRSTANWTANWTYGISRRQSRCGSLVG